MLYKDVCLLHLYLFVVQLDFMRVQLVKMSKGTKKQKSTVRKSSLHTFNTELTTSRLHLHFIGVEVVEDGTEGQAVPPGRAEVGDLYPPVLSGDVLTPLEQRLAGVHQVLRSRVTLVCVCVRVTGVKSCERQPRRRRLSHQPPL